MKWSGATSHGYICDRLNHRDLKERRSPVKAVLLNQLVVRGVGNIYADEALFRAGIHPKRMAASLRRDRVEKLYLLRGLDSTIHRRLEIALQRGIGCDRIERRFFISQATSSRTAA